LKKVFAAIAVLVALGIVGILLVFQLTSGVVDVTESFFTAVSAGEIESAYDDYLSEGFRATTSLNELSLFLQRSALDNYDQASWGSRSISGGQGELEGTIQTRDGGAIPVKIILVKEESGWKIHTIEETPSGVRQDLSKPDIPTQSVLVQLTNASMHDLAVGINAADFTEFYGHIADQWQIRTTPEELLQSFKSFIDQQIDLTVLEGMEPVFDKEPYIDGDNVLHLQGHYQTQPSTVSFNLQYEHPRWSLLGINVEIK